MTAILHPRTDQMILLYLNTSDDVTQHMLFGLMCSSSIHSHDDGPADVLSVSEDGYGNTACSGSRAVWQLRDPAQSLVLVYWSSDFTKHCGLTRCYIEESCHWVGMMCSPRCLALVAFSAFCGNSGA